MDRPTRTTLARFAALVALCASASSCLGIPIPIPPPMAQVQALTDCDGSAECPSGGVIVEVSGLAQPGSLIIVQNISRSLPNGIAYSVSTFAARPNMPIDSGDPDAGAPAAGTFFVRLGPVRAMTGGPVTISQRGDRLSVRQFVEGEAGRYEASNETFITAR